MKGSLEFSLNIVNYNYCTCRLETIMVTIKWCTVFKLGIIAIFQCIYSQRIKKKSWFVCLSTNQRALHHGDCDDKNKLMLDCSSKIAVCNFLKLETGKKCPHVRDVRSAPMLLFLCC
jgi:hypothetical protein